MPSRRISGSVMLLGTCLALLGRSRMWPRLARTRNSPRPRKPSMVFALAGDSTITSVFGTSCPHELSLGCRRRPSLAAPPVGGAHPARSGGQSKVTPRVQSSHRHPGPRPQDDLRFVQPVRRGGGVVHRLRGDRAAARLLPAPRLVVV